MFMMQQQLEAEQMFASVMLSFVEACRIRMEELTEWIMMGFYGL